MTCREGHQDLCGIGILHRDISENNTVLSPYRGGLGALIDFDMATVGCPSLHLDCPPPPRPSVDEIVASLTQSLSPPPAHDKPYEAECIGTTPLVSSEGSPVPITMAESFLCVLVLFLYFV